MAIVAVVVFRAATSETPCGELELTSARWAPAKARTGSPSARQKIADDVMRCGALRANTKAEVLQKIGRPSGSKAADTWTWVIGKGDFVEFPEVMSVEFDQLGRVRRVFASQR